MNSIVIEIKGFKVQFFWCKKSKAACFRFCPSCQNRLDGRGKWRYDSSQSYIICEGCGRRFLFDSNVAREYEAEARKISASLSEAILRNPILSRQEVLRIIARARVSALETA